MNQKFEITGIAHEEYPFLRRIRALRDIGSEVKAGDLGGFVEGEWNLTYEDNDSWIFDDAIAANAAFIYEGACLRDQAIACGDAKICQKAVLSGSARAEDHAYISGARVVGHARVSGQGMAAAYSGSKAPTLSGNSIVHGIVTGNVLVTGEAVVLGDEKIANDSLDRLVVNEFGRHIERNPDREKLTPLKQTKEKKKRKERGQSR